LFCSFSFPIFTSVPYFSSCFISFYSLPYVLILYCLKN
jgi:hypothetical protein